MSNSSKKLGITDVVLRDAHQSLFATRMRIDDMLPIASLCYCCWLRFYYLMQRHFLECFVLEI